MPLASRAPLVGGLLLLTITGAGRPLEAQDPPEPDPTVCLFCHSEQAGPTPGDPHSTGLEGAPFATTGGSCVSCHRDGAAHVEAGGGFGSILAFGDGDAPRAGAEACLACHVAEHPRFFASEHARAGISCTNCHRMHQETYDPGSLLDLVDILATADPARGPDAASISCIRCHGDVGAKFEMNERHRLDAGSMSCVSCHDAHDSFAAARLGGPGGAESCLQCHTNLGGPFIFEHPASRVEGCTACHDPHGSPNRHLLSFHEQGQLCYSCHVQMPGFHLGSPVRFGADANCTNCHSAIHGSNLDRTFLR